MATWSNLDLDVTVMIAEKIEYFEDFKVFGSVCSWWRRATKVAFKPSSSRRTPLLMHVDSPRCSKLAFYNLNNGLAFETELPTPSPTRGGEISDLRLLFSLDDEEEASDWRYFSSRGWLICVTKIGFNIVLMHPLSKTVIQPPAVPEHIIRYYNFHWDDTLYLMMFSKFVLSESPSTTSDYMLAMIFPISRRVAFWRNGDEEWTMFSYLGYRNKFLDITFFNGEFYGVDQRGRVFGFDKSSPPNPRIVASLNFRFIYPGSLYLVESAGLLLLVSRLVRWNEELNICETSSYKIWEVDVDSGVAAKVSHLRNRALFLGCNSSFSMAAMPSQGCKPNCIYYTDNLKDNRYGCDMGIYDFKAGRKIEDLYFTPSITPSPCPSPLWVESPFIQNVLS